MSILNGKNCIVTAHPDDETLWGAGLPIRYPGDWTIICCSIPSSDVIRAWKFFDACEVLGAKGRIMPCQERADVPLKNLDALNLDQYELIATHNEEGEYGHAHHKQINAFITEKYNNKAIWTFQPKGYGGISIKLTEKEYEKKLKALMCYNHLWSYEGENIPKWEALMHRYGTIEGIDFRNESYESN